MNATQETRQLRWLGWLLHAAGLASVAVGAFVFHGLLLGPLVRESKSMAAETARYERLLGRRESIRQQHRQLREALVELQQRSAAVRERIPDEPREAEFLSELSLLAQHNGIQIQDYRRGDVSRHPRLSQLSIHLALSGNYAGLCGFLDQLAALPRLATIEQMSVKAEPDRHSYPVTLTLILYFGLQPAGGTDSGQEGTT